MDVLVIMLILSIVVGIIVFVTSLDEETIKKAEKDLERERRVRRYRSKSEYTYTGLPWMGGEKVKNKYKY